MDTLGSLRSQILRMLGDPTGEGYTNELLLDGIRTAFDAILPWVPKQLVAEITGDGTSKEFDLPADCYEIQAVVVQDTGETLPKAVLSPGVYRGDDISNTNDWIEYPSNKVTFSKTLDSAEVYELFYHAHWEKPTVDSDDNEVLEPPDYCTFGVVLYAAAYSILPASVNVAEIRNWLTKADSGTPEHNPLQKAVSYLMNMFFQEMNRHPKVSKGSK